MLALSDQSGMLISSQFLSLSSWRSLTVKSCNVNQQRQLFETITRGPRGAQPRTEASCYSTCRLLENVSFLILAIDVNSRQYLIFELAVVRWNPKRCYALTV
jgi:hypothetical protein